MGLRDDEAALAYLYQIMRFSTQDDVRRYLAVSRDEALKRILKQLQAAQKDFDNSAKQAADRQSLDNVRKLVTPIYQKHFPVVSYVYTVDVNHSLHFSVSFKLYSSILEKSKFFVCMIHRSNTLDA